jgi:hypothetical protein
MADTVHNQAELTQGFQVYDHEILAVEKVLQRLRERSASRRDLSDFDREIRQRFEDIGFVVRVDWYDTNVEGTFMPEITMIGRVEKVDFDFDKQVAEVTGDILELGDGGVISTPREALEKHEHKH